METTATLNVELHSQGHSLNVAHVEDADKCPLSIQAWFIWAVHSHQLRKLLFGGFVVAPLEITCTVDPVGDGLSGFDAALYAVSTRAAERVGHSFERNLQL